ncbi:hypothetical protein O0555_10005 [Brevibacillus laterosporus]|uniref:hypothetical protein n=1 Tax=Brevibacillus laterosporus TaxID=1465 RepID=UPI0014447335|nr:hypothetical protein [Brevibacillus laterosporus]MBG9772477.1 hypothetical protein [Brevibacillus laterosporus]MBG9799952.1 hypothetical protein [Brevibacillus laterosporus]MCR8937678.1 hypothetical protein [Brevibacillus laterosporus]MCZ0840317.1 hypothetical protein [Brevibacillus laterosporus]MCZ0844396.1 hypothetical protein [Brevibacillus laterosporus]
MGKKHCKCKQRHHRHHHESRSVEHHWGNSNSSSSVWSNHERPKKRQHRHVTVILNPGETLVVHARHERKHKRHFS